MKINRTQGALLIVIGLICSLGFVATNLILSAEQDLAAFQKQAKDVREAEKDSPNAVLKKLLAQVPSDFEVSTVYQSKGAYLIAARKNHQINYSDPYVITFRAYVSDGERLVLDYERTIDSGYAEPYPRLDGNELQIQDRVHHGTEWVDRYYQFYDRDGDGHKYMAKLVSWKYVRGADLQVVYNGATSTLSILTDVPCGEESKSTLKIVSVVGLSLDKREFLFRKPLKAFCPFSGDGIWIDDIEYVEGESRTGPQIYIRLQDENWTTIRWVLDGMYLDSFDRGGIFKP